MRPRPPRPSESASEPNDEHLRVLAVLKKRGIRVDELIRVYTLPSGDTEILFVTGATPYRALIWWPDGDYHKKPALHFERGWSL